MLKTVVMDFNSLIFKEKILDKRGTMEVSYLYEPIFIPITNDTLQRFGNVKIEATSFTVSKPVEIMEISPYLYELANEEEKKILMNVFEVCPFKIITISLDQIFIDKIFAAEFYFIRQKYLDFSKHIYDIVILSQQKKIVELLLDEKKLIVLIKYKRMEELNRIGGIPQDLEIGNFNYLKNINFFDILDFKNGLKTVHNVYVFEKENEIDVELVKKVIIRLSFVFNKIKTS